MFAHDTKETREFDAVGAYLHEIGRYPLLTPAQEVELARTIAHCYLPYKQEDAPHPRSGLTLDEMREYRKGKQAFDKMVQANLRLVVNIAKKYRAQNLDFLDLIQEGTIGLHRAVEKFDYTKGYKLSTYAYWWIDQAIDRAINNDDRVIRLPIHITESRQQIRKEVRLFANENNGRSPTLEEIAEIFDKPVGWVLRRLGHQKYFLSLNQMFGSEKDTELGEFVTGSEPDDSRLVTEAMKDFVERLMEHAQLNPQQQEVLRLRFGMSGRHPLTLLEVAQLKNLSRERIRQIEQKALRKLQRVAKRYYQNEVELLR